MGVFCGERRGCGGRLGEELLEEKEKDVDCLHGDFDCDGDCDFDCVVLSVC